MAILTDEVKHEIVTALASFCGYAETARHIQTCFGIEIDRFQIRTYDPTNSAFSAGEKWREIFEQRRQAYLHQIADIPIAHRAYRLNQLQKLLDRAMQAGNMVLALRILERAAVEVGSMSPHELQYLSLGLPPKRLNHSLPISHGVSRTRASG
jgi:hypothetical protein